MLDFIMTGKIQVWQKNWQHHSCMTFSALLVLQQGLLYSPLVMTVYCWQQVHHDILWCVTTALQKSTPNLEGAFKYLNQNVGNRPFTPEVVQGLEEAAGVGVVITPHQIDATVDRHISKVKPQLLEQRYPLASCQVSRRSA